MRLLTTPKTGDGGAVRRPLAACVSSTMLSVAVASFYPVMTNFGGALLISLLTGLVAIFLLRTTPRLSLATLYWSSATVGGNIVVPALQLSWWTATSTLVGVGVLLLMLLLFNYFQSRQTRRRP